MKKSSPYNTRLEIKESLILEPKSTPTSTLILTISSSLVLTRNCEPAQDSNARIHWLEVSILASSTLGQLSRTHGCSAHTTQIGSFFKISDWIRPA